MNCFSLAGKVILVTGASSGIGRSIAIECSKAGGTVIISGRNEMRLNETYALLEGTDHMSIVADLADKNSLENLIDKLPKLDGIVSNAGISKPVVLQLAEADDIDVVLNVNALMPIHLIRLILQNKKIHKNGSIVFISSINGNLCSSYGSSAYAASKSALTGFMKALALELAPKGITVNSILPGMIETDLLENSAISKDDLEKDRLKYPLKRYGKPEEVAYAAIYLLSDATQWMTGSSIVLDGGFTLQ